MTEEITNEQIMDLLPIVADTRRWYFDGPYIRSDRGECPICAIVNEIVGGGTHTIYAGVAMESLRRLHLGQWVYMEPLKPITNAADGTDDDPYGYRDRMIAILEPAENP